MKKIFLPIVDYIKTRKNGWKKLIVPLIFTVAFIGISFIVSLQNDVEIFDVFTDYVNAQISIVAIFISFSIAIISILVSADNPNIQRLRETTSQDGTIKKLDGKPLTLFQVLLSNLTYNVFIEVLFLIVLIAYSLIKAILPICVFRYLIAFSIFCIAYILIILLETVVQMYHTFWTK